MIYLSSEELKEKQRVADMLVTCHSLLRDGYRMRAMILALFIMGSSLWITALAFVSDDLSQYLTPFNFRPDIWIGLLSVFVFFLSIVELRLDFRGIAEAHRKAAEVFYSVKKEAGYLLGLGRDPTQDELHRFMFLKESADTVGVPIPDNKFLKLKKAHRLKVEVSKHLDSHPGTSIFLFRLKIWWRDNFSKNNL